jgi:hypothetical protein
MVVAGIAMARLSVSTGHSCQVGSSWLGSQTSFNFGFTRVMNIWWIAFSVMLYKYLSFSPGFPDEAREKITPAWR